MTFEELTYRTKYFLGKFGIQLHTYRAEPGGKSKLDAEYEKGKWNHLTQLAELGRFSIVVGYCHHFKENASILEIGCGPGLLKKRLCKSKIKTYTGIDISEKAIQKAKAYQDERSHFHAADALHFQPSQKYDIIIFNEVLIYFEAPAQLIERYKPYLKKEGIFIISCYYEPHRSPYIWRQIETRLNFITGTRIDNYEKNYLWDIKVFNII